MVNLSTRQKVIPREGVESMISRTATSAIAKVIPREGVERAEVIRMAVRDLIRDPERGS